ncbi:hypothetical protein J5H42_21055 [Aeromonas dhakensis]|uniref:hypothetical protein n=1 Tax=Aeromonas dhakensis TaxID=196024 RepID=UPI001AAE5C0A|nr:hypothetical protein [Aeromonas dhakensis]MBO2903209.1 hypothetical protein [Aeromonas dhakensis]MBO2997797.1 hypothetical protein [Aeromonas dhakensis]
MVMTYFQISLPTHNWDSAFFYPAATQHAGKRAKKTVAGRDGGEMRLHHPDPTHRCEFRLSSMHPSWLPSVFKLCQPALNL